MDEIEQNDRDLSVASKSIICRSRKLRQIIDLRDTDKSRYFAITESNNCFIIRSPSLVCFVNEYPREAKRSAIFTQERSQEGEKHGFLYACAEYYLQDGIAHEQTIICRQQQQQQHKLYLHDYYYVVTVLQKL